MDSQLLAMADRVAYRLNAAFADKDVWPYVGEFTTWDGAQVEIPMGYQAAAGPIRLRGVVAWEPPLTTLEVSKEISHVGADVIDRDVSLLVIIGGDVWGLGNMRPTNAPPPASEITMRHFAAVREHAAFAIQANGGVLYDADLDRGKPSGKLLQACGPQRKSYQGYETERGVPAGSYIERLQFDYFGRMFSPDAEGNDYPINRIFYTAKVDGDPEVGPVQLIPPPEPPPEA